MESEAKKPAETIADQVYRKLRAMILDLWLKPGKMVSINDFCSFLKVSRSPVRDALIRLEKEALITTLPQRGTMISRIDMERVVEERYIRECLEGRTVCLFVEDHDSRSLLAMYEQVERQKECAAMRDSRLFFRHDDAFHKIMFEDADKLLSWRTIQNACGHYRRIRLLSMMDRDVLENLIVEHSRMLELIEDGETEPLLRLLERHLSNLDIEHLGLVKRYPELFEDSEPQERQNPVIESDFLKEITVE